MTDKEILIIKSDIFMHRDDIAELCSEIMKMKDEGVILLQPYLHPLVVPDDIEIRFKEERKEQTDAT